jgi:calcium binding protein
MAPAEECSHEMFVMIRWEHGGLGVPLSQLEPSQASAATEVAVADWLYWVGQGYRF